MRAENAHFINTDTKVNGKENQLKFERQETENTQNNTDSNSSFSILSILHFTEEKHGKGFHCKKGAGIKK